MFVVVWERDEPQRYQQLMKSHTRPKKFHFHCSAEQEKNWQLYQVDGQSAERNDHTHTHEVDEADFRLKGRTLPSIRLLL